MRALSILCLLSIAGCGARSGLEITSDAAGLDAPRLDGGRRDAGTDAPGLDTPPPRDVPRLDTPPPDGCIAVNVELTPILAEVLLVIDRSTSMGWALTGPTGPGASRWSILDNALRTELPRWDASSDLGALFFPEVGDACGTGGVPDLTPIPSGAASVLSLFGAAGPGGRTPTAAAMMVAQRYFETHRDPGRPQAVVLATDGAPNCNPDLDRRTCRCTGGAGLPVGCTEAALCLDDARAVTSITALASIDVPTYVIGIDGDPDPELSRVLTRLAVAGGRPNPLDPGRGYYSVTRPTDLGAALTVIEASIARCTLELEGPAPMDAPTTVTIDGDVIPHDPTRTDGWEWSTDGEGHIELFGPACDRAQDGARHELELDVTC